MSEIFGRVAVERGTANSRVLSHDEATEYSG